MVDEVRKVSTHNNIVRNNINDVLTGWDVIADGPIATEHFQNNNYHGIWIN